MAMVGPGQDAILRELSQKKLKRTPPPKAPEPPKNQEEIDTSNPFQGILKKTGKRNSLVREQESKEGSGNNELAAIFARRRAVSANDDESETGVESQDDLPPWKKELLMKKKKLFKDEPLKSEEKENVINDNASLNNNKEAVYPFRDGPPLQPLPSLLRVGTAPRKPPKNNIENVKTLFDKYTNNLIVAPRNSILISEDEELSIADENEAVDDETFEQEDYDDVTDVANKINKRLEEESSNKLQTIGEADFDQEEYDDVGSVKKEMEDVPQETYDDVSVSGNANSESNVVPSGDSGEFGDDVYEPVKGVVPEIPQEEYELLPGEMEEQPKPSPNNNNNKIDTLSKIDQKKLKKEQEELKKKQREESKRLEKEKKKLEDEKKKREKVNAELKKKHKLKGEGMAIGNGLVKDTWKGSGKQELSVKKNESVFILLKDGCPSGKCLIRNEAGNLGYVPAEMIQEYADEDEYAEIGPIQNALAQQSSFPPQSTPSLPAQRPAAADEGQETYDDVKADDDEELYEPI